MKQQTLRHYRRIGLTGGIGSGKSTAAKRFAALGAHVYLADELARQALEPGAACYARVVETFGQNILNPDGTINRKGLAQIVFASDEMRETLNGIVHPYVIETLFALADQDCANEPGAIAIFEVPLLFESGMGRRMDANIVVSCEEQTRVDRIVQRDGVSREHALARIRAQMPEGEKRRRADYILENSSSEGSLFEQVDALYRSLQSLPPSQA
jgi:dephospho-CoA kinase